MNKILLVILDGAADRKSAFLKAKKPYMDMLASNSTCGIWSGPYKPHDSVKSYSVSNPRSLSSVATLEILGYSYSDEPGRGYLEALGLGLRPNKNSVYVRGNFAYVKGKKIIDRRAGRDEKGLDTLVREVNKNIFSIEGVKVKLYRLVGHRVVLVLTGKGLHKHVSDGDIGKNIVNIKQLDIKSKKTSFILNKFLSEAREILSSHPVNKKRKTPANFILLRAAGSQQNIETFRKKYGISACSISGVHIIRGISKYIGMKVVNTQFTELEDDLYHRTKKAIEALEKYRFVLLHINGADTYSHNKDFAGKVRFIEKVDREVFSQLTKLRHITIAVTCDHITDSRTGEHVFGPVPFLMYTPEENGEYEKTEFYENRCNKFVIDSPMKKIMSVI